MQGNIHSHSFTHVYMKVVHTYIHTYIHAFMHTYCILSNIKFTKSFFFLVMSIENYEGQNTEPQLLMGIRCYLFYYALIYSLKYNFKKRSIHIYVIYIVVYIVSNKLDTNVK